MRYPVPSLSPSSRSCSRTGRADQAARPPPLVCPRSPGPKPAARLRASTLHLALSPFAPSSPNLNPPPPPSRTDAPGRPKTAVLREPDGRGGTRPAPVDRLCARASPFLSPFASERPRSPAAQPDSPPRLPPPVRRAGQRRLEHLPSPTRLVPSPLPPSLPSPSPSLTPLPLDPTGTHGSTTSAPPHRPSTPSSSPPLPRGSQGTTTT